MDVCDIDFAGLAAKVAAELVSLAADSPFQQAIDGTDETFALVQDATNPFVESANKAWLDAGDEFASHLLLVKQNNPGKTLAEVVARPDVQEALSVPFAEARSAAHAAIQSAWDAAAEIGVAQAHSDLEALGVSVPDDAGMVDGPNEYLDSLMADVDRNLASVKSRYMSLFADDDLAALDASMKKLTSDLAMRARAGAVVAAQRAVGEARLAVYAAADAANPTIVIKKVWVTHFGPNTCPTCAALHGTVLALDGVFDAAQTFGSGQQIAVYGDLELPPRHVSCHCEIVPIVEGQDVGVGASPESMQAFAQQWAAETPGAAPQAFGGGEISDLARNTEFMRSSDVKGLTEPQYQEARGKFLRCAMGKKA